MTKSFTAGNCAPFGKDPSHPASQGRLGLVCGTFPDGPFIRTGFAWPEHSYFLNEDVKKKACSRAPCSKDGDPKWDEARFEGRARGVSWAM